MLASPAYAKVPIKDVFPPAKNFSDLGSLINVFIPNVMVLSSVILFFIVVIGGLIVIKNAGSGDAQATEKGKKALTAAIIGFILIFSAYWIVQIVQFVTGVKIPGF